MSEETFDQEIHLDDVGTIFEVTIIDPITNRPLNISDATETLIYLLRPAIDENTPEERLDKTAVFTADGSDGRIQYASVAGDLTPAGRWKIQARVTTPNGVWHSQILKFKVEENL